MNEQLHKKPLSESLKSLDDKTQPLWGKMTPQHMVEHLAISVHYATGKLESKPIDVPEKLARNKTFMLSPRPFPKNIGSAANENSDNQLFKLPELKHASLQEAIISLQKSLHEYEQYYAAGAEKLHAHPVFGELTKAEWDAFHHKHFTHHFTQFGLISEHDNI